MNISQLISLLGKQITEGDETDVERKRMADIAVRNKFQAPKKNDSKEAQKKADTQSKKDIKKNDRPSAKMNPKQLRDKNSQMDNNEFEEEDNPLDIFQAQISSVLDTSTDIDTEEENSTENTTKTPDRNINIKEKPFNFEFAKNFDKFVKIVNSFRATESIRNDKVVKQYWEKLTLAEKQAVYIFFDNLTKVSDSEKDPNFKMPRTPSQLGLKISPANHSQQNQTQNISQPGKETSQKIASPAKPVVDVMPKKAQNPVSVQPITVGESANRYISIDKLLQEVK
jgi:hypothetical protein